MAAQARAIYQVGDLTGYLPGDPTFDSLYDAKTYIEKKYTEYHLHPVGLWRMEGNRYPLIEIYVQGDWFILETKEKPGPAGMQKGYKFGHETCPVCGERVYSNWLIRHMKEKHPLATAPEKEEE